MTKKRKRNRSNNKVQNEHLKRYETKLIDLDDIEDELEDEEEFEDKSEEIEEEFEDEIEDEEEPEDEIEDDDEFEDESEDMEEEPEDEFEEEEEPEDESEEYEEELEDESEEDESADDKFVEVNKNMGKKKRRKKKGKKKALKIIGITAGILAAAYVGVSVFFMSHFYVNTTINGKDFSAKTVEDVEKYMRDQVQGYVLTIHENNSVTEQITGEEISLVYVEGEEIENALKTQKGFLWPTAFFNSSATDVTIEVSYDEAVLNTKIENLQAMKVEQTKPVSAYPKYNGEEFVAEPEVLGNAVDVNVLKEKVNQYITEFKNELDMAEEDCYLLPEYTEDSEELKEACETMNTYLKASITYKMKEDVVIDKDVINEWVKADEKLKVTFEEAKVKEWLTAFGDTYDTLGATRTITSPWGKTVQVSGGDYGWSIDEEAEYEAILEHIKKGETVEKEPAYYQTAASHSAQDWGTSYVEVDLSNQHMWVILNGSVALESDVVTGKPGGWETPPGVFAMKEQLYGTTLVGEIDPATGEPEYRTPVAYWMRVTWSGIGFHDATWQSAFGGSRYLDGYGSHGCINMPYDNAGAMMGMVYTGMPVIIHY